ncbi:MAG: helix-turn-helix domain-containing protein [Dehalococcoidia bacterium]
MSDDPRPSLLSTTEAARALGIHQTTLSRWTKAGRVKPTTRTMGGYMLWDLDDLRRQIRELLGDDNPYTN